MTTGARSYSAWLALTAAAAADFDTAGKAPTFTISRSGRIRQVELTLPPGSAGTLHVVPYVVGPAGARVPALQFGKGGDQYLSGDDVIIRLDTDFPVQVGDVVEGWYTNLDAVNAHWFSLIVTIVPEGGGV